VRPRGSLSGVLKELDHLFKVGLGPLTVSAVRHFRKERLCDGEDSLLAGEVALDSGLGRIPRADSTSTWSVVRKRLVHDRRCARGNGYGKS
jgi:hypothetical protein